ncbi:hypothetical protein AAC387_Pa01g3097 [Persea americana]
MQTETKRESGFLSNGPSSPSTMIGPPTQLCRIFFFGNVEQNLWFLQLFPSLENVFFSSDKGLCETRTVQNLLAYCEELTKEESDEEGDTHQGTAVIGIALLAMAEEVGLDMAIQSLKFLLKYEEQNIRRAVPLSLALLCISNPKVNVMDTLSGLSHDTDSEVAMCAIISLGLIGAGTNNAQIASMLQGLAKHYSKEGSLLFCVRIAQGLLHLGKGLLTLSPYHSNHLLLSPTHLAGIITMLCACLDMKSIILGDYPYVLYFLVLAMQPTMLMTG